jgi:hypothetical protein
MPAMDSYSFERWMIDRHDGMIRKAEDQTRLQGWRPRDTLAEMLAAHLRLLADRLDGEAGSSSVVSESA